MEATFPKVLQSGLIEILKSRYETQRLKTELRDPKSEAKQYLDHLKETRLDVLNKLTMDFSLEEEAILNQISEQNGEVWNRYQDLIEKKTKRGLCFDLSGASTIITPYVKAVHVGARLVTFGAAGMAFYYCRSQPLIAVACEVFALSMGVLYKFASELQRFSCDINLILKKKSLKTENTSTKLNEMIAEVYKEMMGSTLILSHYFSKTESLYVDHQSEEKKVDHARMFKGQVEALKALKKTTYAHPYRKLMPLQEMKTVYGKYHGVLSAMQKGIYLWGGVATTMTAYAFYRRAYLMIGAAFAHVVGAYFFSRIITSRVSRAAKLKDATDETFNETYMSLFDPATRYQENSHASMIQAEVIQLDTILKLIPQTA
jgi:hypothetical protein